MFNDPIRYVPLTSIEEVKAFSCKAGLSYKKKIYVLNDRQIAYADENGVIWVTASRIGIEPILGKNGYVQDSMSVPV